MTENAQLVEHLFRHEAGRLTSTLVRILGPGQWDLAEDIVQSTLITALERWAMGDVPNNPAAWLTQVAKRRAIDILRKRQTHDRASPQLVHAFHLQAITQQLEAHFAREFEDDVLRMMFSCCAPELSPRAQIALILKTLCGFSTKEIAHALFISTDAVERQISRSKTLVRQHGLCDVTDAESLQTRLPIVHQAIYLIFNEGYHSTHPDLAERNDFAGEAMRLCGLLIAREDTATSTTHALMALLCLNASRMPARQGVYGSIITLEAQDRTKWVPSLQHLGFGHLSQSASGNTLTPFHIEAAMAATHASAPDWRATNWHKIVDLYDLLVQLDDSSVVQLNRAIAIGCLHGAQAGLTALDAIDHTHLGTYPFLPAAYARFHTEMTNTIDAANAYRDAIQLARHSREQAFFEAQLQALNKKE